MKTFIKLSAIVAAFSITCQMAQAAQSTQLFNFTQPAQTQGNQAVTPNFTLPSQGMAYAYNGYGNTFYVKGLRVAGVLDWLKDYSLTTVSVPNALGQKTKTQVCATEFHNPLTGVLIYRTPVQSLVSGLYVPPSSTQSSCGYWPANQAANPLGLLVELVSMQQNTYTPPATIVTTGTVKLRVLDGGTKAVKWTGIFASTAALGLVQYGELVDVNNDGTDEVVIIYSKDITPLAFQGVKRQLTRQVRNVVTGAGMGQFTWTETYTY